MPAKRKSAAKATPVASTRQSRSLSTVRAGDKRKASPSPAPPAKKGVGAKKVANENEAKGPTRQSSRGRSASKQKEEPVKRGGSKSSHVTRAAVEEVETKKSTQRGRSRTPATPKSTKATPKSTPKAKTPTKSPKQVKETPKQRAATPRQRSTTPKTKPVTPKEKVVTLTTKTQSPRSAPKQRGNSASSDNVNVSKLSKNTPEPKKNSKTVTKSPVAVKEASPQKKKAANTETSPSKSPSRSSRRSRGEVAAEPEKKEEEQEQKDTEESTEEDVPKAANDDKEDQIDDKTADKDNNQEKVEASEVEEEEQKVEENNLEEMETEEAMNEDENVEQDQVLEEKNNVQTEVIDEPCENAESEATVEQKEIKSNETQEPEEEKSVPVCDVKQSDETLEKETEEDVTESQAESEQVESEDKECESAESEQVEADAPMETTDESGAEPIVINEDSNSSGKPEIINEESGDSEQPEIISDVSEKDEEVIELNEDSGDAVIILDSKEVGSENQPQEENVSEIESAPVELDNKDGIEIAVEAEENEAPSSSQQKENGVSIPDQSEGKKRKIDEVEDVEDSGEFTKKAKAGEDENNLENGTVSQEEDNVADDYVVIEMSDVPPNNSTEVTESIPKESVSNNVGNDSNPIFKREFVPNPAFSGPGDVLKQFSLVSYNILADCHLFRNDYSFTEKKYLVPEYRLEQIIKELKYLDGDIICMQEVDPTFFSEKLLPSLQSVGYEGFHKKRTADYFNEGEATFYKTGRFTIVESQLHRQADLVEKVLKEGSVDEGVQEAVRKYVDLPDVLVVTKLRCNNTRSEITVGNVHINWGEMKTPDIQCVQIASAIKETVSKAGNDNVPHIICGDFNSPPLSPGYLVARDGYPSGDETITKLQQIKGLQLSEGKTDSLVNCLWPAFQHTSSSLKSAYKEVQDKEPDISSYNQVMCECVDYIFYSSTSIDNVGIYRVPSKDKIMETGGTPNVYFPSDHVSVKAVLSFK